MIEDATSDAPAHVKIGHFRWVICALLLFGTTKNYMDRYVLGVLQLTLQRDLGWNDIDYGHIVLIFQASYALGLAAVGWLMDRLGTRLGYALAMVFWSVASMAHALAGSLAAFMAARAALGFGESGIFPASIKATAEWFPQKERALATGIFNAGTNFGAIITPFVVSWITLRFNWRWSFIFTGALGFIWLIFWLLLYRKPEEHPRLSRAELEYIRSDPAPPPVQVKWPSLLAHRQTWAVMSGKFITDPIWWFYLFWAPGFLERKHGLTLAQIAVPIMVIYVIADAGSVAGGWLSSWFIGRGWSVNLGRKIAMLICAACVVPVIEASHARGLWTAVLLIGLAAAAHQGFSANMYTLASDMFPRHAVASVVGLAGMAGAIGGMLIAEAVGYILQTTGSYVLPFMIAGAAYIIAIGAIHLLSPRLEPAKLGSVVTR